MSLTIGLSNFDDELLKRKRLEEAGGGQYGNDGVNGLQQGVEPNGSAEAFNEKYGATSIFGISENAPVSSGRERFNVAGANAGTAGGSSIVNDMNSSPSNASIWTQGGESFNNPNIQPGGPSAVGGVTLASPNALQQPGGADRQTPEGAVGQDNDGAPTNEKPSFGAGDIFALTGGLDLSPAFAPPMGDIPPATPEPTGDATLTTTSPEDVAEDGNVSGEGEEPGIEEPTDGIEEPDEVEEPEDQDTDAEIRKQQEEDEAKKAEEEAARKAAEKREEEQKAA